MTKVVCRFLDESGTKLLAWLQLNARIPGDGKVWCDGMTITPLLDGHCKTLSVHWCDINVEIQLPCDHPFVAGVPVVVYGEPTPLIICGPMPQGLIPVTVGSQVIGIPTGTLGATGRAG